MIKAVLFVLIKFALRRACAAQGLRSAGPIITLKFKLEQSPVHPTALAPALASNLVPTGKGVCFAALSETLTIMMMALRVLSLAVTA